MVLSVKGNLVAWTSENPHRVLLSSTEVECRGLSQFAKENLWQRQLQLEVGLFDVKDPTIVYEDNTATISMGIQYGDATQTLEALWPGVGYVQGICGVW